MQRPFVIGIAGGTGSGKTCVTDILRRRYDDAGIAILNQDSYYLDRSGLDEEERRSLNYDHPSAIDHDLLLRHLTQLVNGSAIERPCYCFVTHTRLREFDLVLPEPIILVEGIFALWDLRLRSRMDLKIYVDADPGLRFIRWLQRDVLDRGRTVESVVKQYHESVRPMHETFIEPTRDHANLVIDNSGSLENLPTLLEDVIDNLVAIQRTAGADAIPEYSAAALQIVGDREEIKAFTSSVAGYRRCATAFPVLRPGSPLKQ